MRKFDDHLATLFIKILYEFLNLSEREMEDYVRKEIEKFLNKDHTTSEVYDFCDHISKLSCKKISEGVCVGDISSFMQVTLDVTKYYEK